MGMLLPCMQEPLKFLETQLKLVLASTFFPRENEVAVTEGVCHKNLTSSTIVDHSRLHCNKHDGRILRDLDLVSTVDTLLEFDGVSSESDSKSDSSNSQVQHLVDMMTDE